VSRFYWFCKLTTIEVKPIMLLLSGKIGNMFLFIWLSDYCL